MGKLKKTENHEKNPLKTAGEKTSLGAMVGTVFGMMMNPAGTLKGAMLSTKWYFSLGVSGVAFFMFFLQTGLDLYKTGQKGFGFVMFFALVGALYGLVLIPALGFLVAGFLKISKTERTVKEIITMFCLSYSGALVYGITGLITSFALGWKTSVAFGVSGVLWAIGPMIVTIREMTGGKNAMSIPIATLISAVILLSWALLGKM